MDFPEPIKLEAKRRSNFRCCVCQQPWVEVHHIVPQADGGPSTIDNAAPLCGSCHNQYGANPALRKQLREMRDHWWGRCAASAAEPAALQLAQRLDVLQSQYQSGSAKQDALLGEVKNLLMTHLSSTEKAVNSATTITEALASVTAFSTGSLSVSADALLAKRCSRCGALTTTTGTSQCQSCGAPLA